ncbi:MAG: glycosyltransferase family 2 protein [Planctomycetota bacterium]|jgi:glycosyltransferase involved in cell wall biosynthesis
MRVSTVIPVYNRRELVCKAIESAQVQNIDGHQIVLMDNCSTDGTWEILQQYASEDPRIKAIKNHENVGPVRNWKLGVQASEGEYCHLLFSDDWLEPGFLKSALDRFDDQTAFVLVGHSLIDSTGILEESSFQVQPSIAVSEFYESAIFLNPNGIQVTTPISGLFRREELLDSILIEIPNPFGIDYGGHGAGPDQLIFLLVARNYPWIRCVNRRMVAMRAHEGSITFTTRDLNLAREWARWYFVGNYWPEAINRYRSMLWLKSFKNTDCLSVYEYIQRRIGGRVESRLAIEYGVRRLLGLPWPSDRRNLRGKN